MQIEMIYERVRFVQLSDIHFGQERDGTLVAQDDIRKMLVRDATELAEAHGPAHLIIVAGDTAFAGKEAQYKHASDWLEQLANAVKCLGTDIRVVPGNHDCDLSQISRLARTMHRSIRTGTIEDAYADLEDAAKRSEEANPLLPKLEAYRAFAGAHDSDFESAERPFWTKDFALLGGATLRLVGMTSVLVSDDDDRQGDMILGNSQYILSDEQHLVYAVVLHHPLDWFKDKFQARQYLDNRARLVMVGHEHVPDAIKTVNARNNEQLCVRCGATNPPRPTELVKYAYNWIEVSLRENAGTFALAVTSRPRVWVAGATRFAADTDQLAGKECSEHLIACPGLKPVKPSVRRETGHMVTGTTLGSPRNGASGAVDSRDAGGTVAMDDDAALARLKRLFWRHLDWRQRLKVLVDAGALPLTADRPVPQTMERLALKRAREQGTLPSIWDATMKHVPEAKREPNPFNRARS
jgi:predicted phosphodiesterase